MRGSFSVYRLSPSGLGKPACQRLSRPVFYTSLGEQKQAKYSYFIRFIINSLRALLAPLRSQARPRSGPRLQ
jgi:hypothetical protein